MKNYNYAVVRFSALLHANTISGTVTDSSNNPIIGVSIYVPELHKGTATDLGRYS
jgi:iron complex outermembrane receptor protein